MEILQDLNPAQLEAVKHVQGPLLILAGPGSGKTRVIAHRIAYLIAEEHVHPYRIVAVTFTNKASRELRDRVVGLLGDAAQSLALGTFHAICARILRVDGGAVGVERAFAIFDDSDQQQLMRAVLSELGVDPRKFAPRAVLSTISSAKSELITPAVFASSVHDYFGEVVARAYGRYQTLLEDNNALDFDDMIMRTVELLREHDSVREKYQQRFLHVLIDEFQDTNVAQYVLARQLAGGHGNICVVGDPDQSIYSWRSADIRNILNFEQDFKGAKVVYLEQNYRSTQTILDSAHAVIAGGKGRKEKDLWTEQGPGDPVVVFEAYDDVEEAGFVAAEVQELVKDPARSPGDVAVMYRTNGQSRALEEAFIREQIKYRLVGGTRFYERKEVKDILAYLRLVHNPFDSVAFERVVNVPPRGIGAKTLEELGRWAGRRGLPPYAALQALAEAAKHADDASPPGDASPSGEGEGDATELRDKLAARSLAALLAFLDLLNSFIDAAKTRSVADVMAVVLERTKYRRYLLDQQEEDEARIIDSEERWENVQQLLTLAAEYDGLNQDAALSQFLEDVALISDQDTYDDKAEAVTLITLHAAKGLEFPVVFMVGMEEGVLPHIRSFDDPSQLEEERRLCYVGITRAKERLYLVRAFRRRLMGTSQHNPASRFLKDLPAKLIASQGAAAHAGGGRRFGRAGSTQRKSLGWLGKAGENGEARTSPDVAVFAAGDKVHHERFGDGIVVSCIVTPSDQEVTVAFKGDAGLKKLLLTYARLEKV
ncbi:MAG: UvrD-helicase domain-containing protein [Chloroflexi bacterium]|nr:UvrD-helicase domain-containing protein [Chloroflexota bacterium]